MKPLSNKVALVTGASRGIGKGIALSLGKAGAKVYITGRTINEGESASRLSGTIYQTANEISELGGECIAIQCDHVVDAQVESVFDTIARDEQKLDILVNNVWGGYEHFTDGTEFWNENEFWTQPSSRWDSMFQAGIRAHFIASRLAAPLLIEHQGLIINLSFFAAQRNDKGVAYGAAKAATDHMVACMAEELRRYNVATISLYPGVVRTEAVLKAAEHIDLSNSESPQFIGRAVAALACDKRIMKKSGKRPIAADLGVEYKFKDIDGRQPKPMSGDNI